MTLPSFLEKDLNCFEYALISNSFLTQNFEEEYYLVRCYKQLHAKFSKLLKKIHRFRTSSHGYGLHNYLIANQQPTVPLDIQKHPII